MDDQQMEWLSLSDAAEYLGVHPSTVRAWADKGDLPVHRTAGGTVDFIVLRSNYGLRPGEVLNPPKRR